LFIFIYQDSCNIFSTVDSILKLLFMENYRNRECCLMNHHETISNLNNYQSFVHLISTVIYPFFLLEYFKGNLMLLYLI
jgi:hypothetical protein